MTPRPVAEDRDEDVVEAEEAIEREVARGRVAAPHQGDEGVAVERLDQEVAGRQRPVDGEGEVDLAPEHAAPAREGQTGPRRRRAPALRRTAGA